MQASDLGGLTKSVDPESNQGPSDLQSDALPTELSTVTSFARARIWEDNKLRGCRTHGARSGSLRFYASKGFPKISESRARSRHAAIAQLGERQTEDLEVPGSIPGLGTFMRAPRVRSYAHQPKRLRDRVSIAAIAQW